MTAGSNHAGDDMTDEVWGRLRRWAAAQGAAPAAYAPFAELAAKAHEMDSITFTAGMSYVVERVLGDAAWASFHAELDRLLGLAPGGPRQD